MRFFHENFSSDTREIASDSTKGTFAVESIDVSVVALFAPPFFNRRREIWGGNRPQSFGRCSWREQTMTARFLSRTSGLVVTWRRSFPAGSCRLDLVVSATIPHRLKRGKVLLIRCRRSHSHKLCLSYTVRSKTQIGQATTSSGVKCVHAVGCNSQMTLKAGVKGRDASVSMLNFLEKLFYNGQQRRENSDCGGQSVESDVHAHGGWSEL